MHRQAAEDGLQKQRHASAKAEQGRSPGRASLLLGLGRGWHSPAGKELWKGGGWHGETPTNHLSSEGFHPSSKQDRSHPIPRREDLPGHPRSQGEGQTGQREADRHTALRSAAIPAEHGRAQRGQEPVWLPAMHSARSGEKKM